MHVEYAILIRCNRKYILSQIANEMKIKMYISMPGHRKTSLYVCVFVYCVRQMSSVRKQAGCTSLNEWALDTSKNRPTI